MRRPLPHRRGPSTSRPGRSCPGQDEEAWLEVNNRAFAGHPDRAAGRRDTLAAAGAEPWFDPAGFLLHERDGRAGRLLLDQGPRTTHDPPLGEIYVIAVDPDFQGTRARPRADARRARPPRRARARRGMLYVDADQQPAVRLYRALGFTCTAPTAPTTRTGRG